MRVKIQNIINKWIEKNHDKVRQKLINSITFNEDAFQDAYLELSTQPLQNFDGNVEKLFIDTYRRKLRQEFYRGYRMIYPQPTFFDLLVECETEECYTPCLAQVQRYAHRYLNGVDRIIFDLWVLNKKSCYQISDYMGITRSTVSQHKKIISTRLKEHYRIAL